jgi:hypothetical protein
MQTPIMKRIISTEYLIAAILVAVFFVTIGGFDWYWLPIMFLVFDTSAVGYFFSPKIGAVIYNIGHSIVGPAIALVVFVATSDNLYLFIALTWLFHIFVDRALGYGLKHTTGFHYTHLGTIGRKKK